MVVVRLNLYILQKKEQNIQILLLSCKKTQLRLFFLINIYIYIYQIYDELYYKLIIVIEIVLFILKFLGYNKPIGACEPENSTHTHTLENTERERELLSLSIQVKENGALTNIERRNKYLSRSFCCCVFISRIILALFVNPLIPSLSVQHNNQRWNYYNEDRFILFVG